MYSIKGKVAIITGGASGIGLATAKALLEKGGKVLIADYNKEALDSVLKDLKGKNQEVEGFVADVSKEEDVKNMVAAAVKAFGRLDIIFNNAGIGVLADTESLSFEDYNNVIKINQDGVFFGCKHAIPEMKKVGGGAIVNTASILGLVGQQGAFAYNASKGAVNLMTKSLALEVAPHKIRVNSVCPGYVESGMVNKEALGDYYETLVERHPIGRIGFPEEIAHAVVFLIENEFMTGFNLAVDGGYTAQ